MEFTINQRDLMRAVSRAESAIEDRKATGIIAYVLLRAQGTEVVASGTSHIKSLATSCRATVKAPGAILVRDIGEKLSGCPGELTLRTSGTNLEIRAAGSKAKKPLYSVPFIAGDDFPPLPKPGPANLTLPSAALARIITQTGYAAPDDENKSAWSCVRLESGNGRVLGVAAQSARMATAEAEVPCGDFADALTVKALKLIAKLCSDHADEDVAISVTKSGNNNGHIHLSWSDTTVSLARCDDGFPPWRKVWPTAFTGRAQVARAELIAAIDRAERVIETAGSISLFLTEGKLSVAAASQKGEAHSELESDYAGPDWDTVVSATNTKQALAVMQDDTVQLNFNDPLAPILVHGASEPSACQALIMPIRK